MTTLLLSPQEQKIQTTAQELSEQGYAVITRPSTQDLPFDLGNYTPGLVAKKGSEGIILEVQTNLKRLSIDRLQEITEQVASHPGWRFLLVTLEDAIEGVFPNEVQELPTWEDLQNRLSQLKTLLETQFLEPALLFGWSILEAALRRRSLQQNLPIQRFPSQKLLNHAYSSGEITLLEFDVFKDSLLLRNQVAHGRQAVLELAVLERNYEVLERLIQRWS